MIFDNSDSNLNQMQTKFSSGRFEDIYELCEEIGCGQYAVVYKCIHKEEQQSYAAKFIRKRKAVSSLVGMNPEDIRKEVDILSDVQDHENIISLFEVFEDRNFVIVVTELVVGGELFEVLSETDALSEEEAVLFMTQILQGVQHLHSKNIVHLDLKPENILVVKTKPPKVRIIDFGLSKYLRHGLDAKDIVGTPEYVAPETINYDPITLATDVWSLGVMTFMMLTGCSPFLGATDIETFSNISMLKYNSDALAEISPYARDFIKSLLVRNAKQRPTVSQLLQHPWIQPAANEDVQILRRQVSVKTRRLGSFVDKDRWRMAAPKLEVRRPCASTSAKKHPSDANEGKPPPGNPVGSKIAKPKTPVESRKPVKKAGVKSKAAVELTESVATAPAQGSPGFLKKMKLRPLSDAEGSPKPNSSSPIVGANRSNSSSGTSSNSKSLSDVTANRIVSSPKVPPGLPSGPGRPPAAPRLERQSSAKRNRVNRAIDFLNGKINRIRFT